MFRTILVANKNVDPREGELAGGYSRRRLTAIETRLRVVQRQVN